MSTAAFLLLTAVWCVAGTDTTAISKSHDCLGEELCRFETEAATLDPSPGNGALEELSAAELTQICDRTGFHEAMTAIRRRQRGDPTPNHADLAIEAEKCLVLDEMRSSDPKKWTHDIMSLSFEQYTLLGLDNSDIRRHSFVSLFQVWAYYQILAFNHRSTSPERKQVLAQEWSARRDDLYQKAGKVFSLSDDEISDRDTSLMMPLSHRVGQFQESHINSEFYRIVDWIELDEIDEKNLLLMLSHIDPSALDRLISGDVPGLKSKQVMSVGGIVVSTLCAIVFGCTLLLKRSGIFNETGREKDENGRWLKGGGKKKRGRKP